ncbi:hypothetical protein D623_10007342 [Myotis brandtii]|uniref:CLLAC-motif containing domain-containing protein n=1 Tax=Myotis brandtii TaxID=109478 RepID=S7MEG3_MYOBR|nr:hypothetical protein D623_10007342 [Myotis brandtii]
MDRKHGKYVVNVEQSENQPVKRNCHNWTLWNIFLACLLACVITTAIGVLIICLVNNRGNDNSSIVIKVSPNDGEPVTAIHGKTSAAPQPTVTTMSSTEPTTVATSKDSTTISTSTESTATIAATTTSTAPTTSTRSTELTATTAITPTSTKTREATS